MVTLLRLKQVCAARGIGKSALYQDIQHGLFTPPVKIGERISAWPDYEVKILNQACIAGKSRAEIERLVARLTALRGTLCEAAAGEITLGDAAAFASLVDTCRKTIETAELERRITALEEATANESV